MGHYLRGVTFGEGVGGLLCKGDIISRGVTFGEGLPLWSSLLKTMDIKVVTGIYNNE